MSLKRDYSKNVRRELRRFAVWEPGRSIAVGDYGLLHDGTFEKYGSISEFEVTFETSRGNPHPFEFASADTIVTEATGRATADGGHAAGNERAVLNVTFGSAHALLIRSAATYVVEMSAQRILAEKLRAHPRWNFSWKIVAGMRLASPATILMGATAKSRLTIEGGADAIKQFMLGTLQARADLLISGEAALKVIGAKGPILLDLIYLPRYFGTIARGGEDPGGLPEEPYVQLSVGEDITDDPREAAGKP